MALSRRDRLLARYAYASLNIAVAAAMARSRDRVARLLGTAALATGVGVPPGFQFLLGADGARLQGADGAYLYGRAA